MKPLLPQSPRTPLIGRRPGGCIVAQPSNSFSRMQLPYRLHLTWPSPSSARLCLLIVLLSGSTHHAWGQCFGTATNIAVEGTTPKTVALRDVNGDGLLDIITANSGSDNVSVLLGTGTGSFGAPTNFPVGDGPSPVALGDVNRDGRLDIITANYSTDRTVSVLLGTGTGSFGAPTNFRTGFRPVSVVLGDVNGDGKPDIITANYDDGTVSILLGTGTGVFGAPAYLGSGQYPQSVAVGDVNEDGKLDIVFSDKGIFRVSVYLGTGTGSFGFASNLSVGNGPSSVALGDVNGDGKPDVITANIFDNNVSVLVGTGTGSFGTATNYAVGDDPSSVALGDVNGDGRPDIITANNSTDNVSVLLQVQTIGITAGPGSGSAVCVGSTVRAPVSVLGPATGYQWYKNGALVSGQTSATLTLTNVTSASAGSYAVVISSFCNSVTSTAFSLTVNSPPTATLTNNGPFTCAQTSVTLTAGSNDPNITYFFSRDGEALGRASTNNTKVVNQTGIYTVQISTATGCTSSITTTVTGNTTPPAPPSLLTQTGQTYPGGQSSVTVSQNTTPVILVVSGCGGGTITWAGGSATTLSVSTATLGSFTYAATCTLNGCTSAPATATVVVQALPATLSVSHQDADRNPTNNTIKPYLQLNNEGTSSIAYGEITLRYWLTVEQFAPMTNLSVYYAQLGSDKVKLRYVELPQPRQGALGYIEYSFLPAAGSLAGGANSGPIQTGIGKADWTPFNEADDYSYANNGSYAQNPRITAYRNGTLIWGTEPAGAAPVQSLKVYTENKNGPSTNTISTYLQLRNEGNVPVSYSDLKVRYYFTSEGSQPLNLYLDYAVLGSNNVKATLVKINPPLANADTYIEFSFPNLTKLYPLSSTGNLQYRIAKSDWSNFNQANDHSYQNGTSPLLENNRVVVYAGGVRVYGSEPGAGARVGAEGVEVPLSVTVLGNPVTGSEVSVEVRGAQGQPLRLQLSDLKGQLVSERAVGQAGAVEQQTLPLGQSSAGLLLLRVSTPTQRQTVKVLKAQ